MVHEDQNTDLQKIACALRRRRKLCCAVAGLGILLSAAVTVWLPACYRSKATILVEAQGVPKEIGSSLVGGYIEERIQILSRIVLSNQNLGAIIDRYDLYPGWRGKTAIQDVVDKMRGDVSLDLVTAEVTNPNTGKPSNATIAFDVSYSSASPQVAAQVAGVLASLFLEENRRTRQDKIDDVLTFLEQEAASYEREIGDAETRLAQFKERNIFTLPELLQFNLQATAELQRDKDSVTSSLRMLQERKISLEGQLATMEPTRYAMPAQSRDVDARPNKDDRAADRSLKFKPDNPAYINLQTQIVSTRLEMDSLQNRLKETEAQQTAIKERIHAMPAVEREYRTLQLNLDKAKSRHQETVRRLHLAREGRSLEEHRVGERLTLIEPPVPPLSPAKPNRPAILVIGLFLSLCLGAATSITADLLDQSVKDAQELARLTGLPTLAEAPHWPARRSVSSRRGLGLLALALFTALIVIPTFWQNAPSLSGVLQETWKKLAPLF